LLGDLVAEAKVVKGKKIGKEQPYFLPGTDVSKWYESSNDGEIRRIGASKHESIPTAPRNRSNRQAVLPDQMSHPTFR